MVIFFLSSSIALPEAAVVETVKLRVAEGAAAKEKVALLAALLPSVSVKDSILPWDIRYL